MSRQQKALKNLLSTAYGGERAISAIFEEHADSVIARDAVQQMRRDLNAQQEEQMLWLYLEIQTELKRTHAEVEGWKLFGHCNHHGQNGGSAVQHKCWCCCVANSRSWQQTAEVSYPGTEDSCFACFTAIEAVHERHQVKYSPSRLLGVVKRMYAFGCELTEEVIREEVQKLREPREVERGEPGSAADERRPAAESSERSSSRKRDQDGKLIEGDSVANAQSQRGMVCNYLKGLLKQNPARPVERLPAGDKKIDGWKNRKFDDYEDYATGDLGQNQSSETSDERAVLRPASEVRHHSPERYGADPENKYVRQHATGPGWWYEDRPRKKKQQTDQDRGRGHERYRDGGEYTWRGSLGEHVRNNSRSTPYNGDEYGEWRGSRRIQGGWGNQRNSDYPLANHRATGATGHHEWGRRAAYNDAVYDTGASRDYDGRDYDRHHRRW